METDISQNVRERVRSPEEVRRRQGGAGGLVRLHARPPAEPAATQGFPRGTSVGGAAVEPRPVRVPNGRVRLRGPLWLL